MFQEITNNYWIVLFLAVLVLGYYWWMTQNLKEGYGNGAMGPFAISSGNQSFATRPGENQSFRYLWDLSNW